MSNVGVRLAGSESKLNAFLIYRFQSWLHLFKLFGGYSRPLLFSAVRVGMVMVPASLCLIFERTLVKVCTETMADVIQLGFNIEVLFPVHLSRGPTGDLQPAHQ